jgi:inner membrane protein
VDNVTHSLAGLLLAEVAIFACRRQGQEPSSAMRSVVRVASAFANNLNDADFLYARRWAGKLGYLLHHRGHTHTLLAALLLGVLVFAAASAWLRFKDTKVTTSERRTLLGACLLGPFVHIGMDLSNNYGVHPFWPFDLHWYYGDTLFIIEPWLWVVAVPTLCGLLESRLLRAVLVNLLGFVVILAWVHPMLHWGAALLLSLGALACWRVSGRLSAGQRLLLAGSGWALVTLVFFVGARSARAEALQRSLQQAEARGARERAVDVVVTPTPANPLCYSALVVATSGENYVLRAASVSLASWLIPATSCRVEPTGFTAALKNSRFESSPELHWEGEWQRPLAELRALQRGNCWARAMLRFARVPFWQARPHGELVLGDLRYDRLPGNGFAEVHTRQHPERCPDGVPPWLPPRGDLLGP